MQSENHFILDREIIEKDKELRAGYGFRRTLDGDFETVAYFPGSTIRVWLNKEYLNYPLHWHPEMEIIVPVENTYEVEVNGISYTLCPGDIFVIPSGALHTLIAPENGKRIILLFDVNILSRLSGFSFWMSYFSEPVMINRQTCQPIYENAKDLINKLCKDYYCNDVLRDILFYSDVLQLFSDYVRYQTSLEQTKEEYGVNPHHTKEIMMKLNMVYDYINEHISEDLQLETVADVAGFSKFHFSRIFKQYSHMNYYDYLCTQRIKAAESLLFSPSLSITEVALQSGFASLTTFNRTFKKIKGCTPTQYRNLFHAQMHS